MHSIPGATTKQFSDGVRSSLKYKTPLASFNLRPVPGQAETYDVQVTTSNLPGLFKNSGLSSFGWFRITRFPGRNAITRPKSVKPMHGNAVLMWSHLQKVEQDRALEHLEKLCRTEIPRIPLDQAKAA